MSVPRLADNALDGESVTGVTLMERAKLVLRTLGRTPDEVRAAYRERAKSAHPDAGGANAAEFHAIHEAYRLLLGDPIPKRPLLADDDLMLRLIGRPVAPLLNRQKEWESYERQHRDRFYGHGVI